MGARWGEAKASTQDQAWRWEGRADGRGGGGIFLGGVYDFDALWR